MIYDIQKKKPALNIKEGIFYNDLEGFSIKISEKDSDGKILRDILIYDHTGNNGNDKVIVSETGVMQLTKDEKFLELILYNGHSYIDLDDKKNNPYRVTHFKENLIRFDLSSFNVISNSEDLYKGHYAMLNNQQLDHAIDSLTVIYSGKKEKRSKYFIDQYFTQEKDSLIDFTYSVKNKNKQYKSAINQLNRLQSKIRHNKNNYHYRESIIAKHKIEWHRKISLAVACFILFLIGAPLGAIIRKGGFGVPVLVSVFFFIIFHVLSMIGEKSARELNMEPFEGMWLTNIIFTPIAIILIYKAKNDFQLFDLSGLQSKINQLFKSS